MDVLRRIRERGRALLREVRVIAIAVGDRTAPWPARVVALVVVAYALSPIDLIPDPIPVLGLLDDVVLLPLGILLVRRLLPHDVLQRARVRAAEGDHLHPHLRAAGGVFVVATWVLLGWLVYRAVR